MPRYSRKSEGRFLGGRKMQRELRRNREMELKRRGRIKKTLNSPECQAKLGKAQHARFKKAEERKKISKSLHEFWTPEEKERASLLKKMIYKEKPEIREKIDLGVTFWWHEHADVKPIYALRAILQLLADPEHYRKFLAGGTNPEERKIATLFGFLVRSIGEKEIAEFLHFHHVKTEYETITFYLDGWLCTPDFWLPKYKIFIEFYGGFPGSRKKKIIKNRIYKKYGIPCIFITPSELRNLDYSLLSEIGKIVKTSAWRKFRLSSLLKPKLSRNELRWLIYIVSKHKLKLPTGMQRHIEILKMRYKIN
ncbi:MAG: hypothetical protein V1886_03095 [archaeon]